MHKQFWFRRKNMQKILNSKKMCDKIMKGDEDVKKKNRKKIIRMETKRG